MDEEEKLPDIIYVRDISEADAVAFNAIKKKFGIKSNSKVVKLLFTKYITLLTDYSNLNLKFEESKKKNRILTEKIDIVREFGKVLSELEE